MEEEEDERRADERKEEEGRGGGKEGKKEEKRSVKIREPLPTDHEISKICKNSETQKLYINSKTTTNVCENSRNTNEEIERLRVSKICFMLLRLP